MLLSSVTLLCCCSLGDKSITQAVTNKETGRKVEANRYGKFPHKKSSLWGHEIKSKLKTIQYSLRSCATVKILSASKHSAFKMLTSRSDFPFQKKKIQHTKFSQCISRRMCLRSPNKKSSNAEKCYNRLQWITEERAINAIQRIGNCETLEVK